MQNAECRMQNAECRNLAECHPERELLSAFCILHSAFCILHSAFCIHLLSVFTSATTSFSNDVPPNSLFTSRIQPYISSLSTVRTVMSWLPVPEAIRLLRS